MIINNKFIIDLQRSCIYLTNQKWFSVVCTLNDNDIRHHSGQNVVDSLTRRSRVSLQQILTTVMTNIVVIKSTDNAEPLLICFLPQYSMPKKVFISERDQIITQGKSKRCLYNFLVTWSVCYYTIHCMTIWCEHDARSAVYTLINNGKLANQMVRLQAIVVKSEINVNSILK